MHNIQYDVTKYAKKQEYVTYNQEKNCWKETDPGMIEMHRIHRQEC